MHNRIFPTHDPNFTVVNGTYFHKSHKMRVRLDPPEHSFDCECQNCRDCEPITFMDDCGDCEDTAEFASFIDGFNYRGREDLIIGGVLGALAFALFISLCRL